MGWASGHIDRLQRGETVSFRPHGNSMLPRIRSGALCTVAPAPPSEVRAGDVVLCKVSGRQFLHLVWNNRGHMNGWVSAQNIYGKLVAVAD